MKWILFLGVGGAAVLWYLGAQTNPQGSVTDQLQSGFTRAKAAVGLPCCDGCAGGKTPCGGAPSASGANTPKPQPQVIQIS